MEFAGKMTGTGGDSMNGSVHSFSGLIHKPDLLRLLLSLGFTFHDIPANLQDIINAFQYRIQRQNIHELLCFLSRLVPVIHCFDVESNTVALLSGLQYIPTTFLSRISVRKILRRTAMDCVFCAHHINH
ncbi:hypothetical protein OIU84_007821 [Salix udensis]|uniref:Uncharacterized protein n=1 Tax=Salix udensis TaxID=889485 RepID=A0AAD6JVT3_9ROSI|nr:hypothetical protein OIU84_007821 [Salix udensis]